MVAHEGDPAVVLVGRAVDSMLPGLAPKAADLVGGRWREAAAEVFMWLGHEVNVVEQVHAVALDAMQGRESKPNGRPQITRSLVHPIYSAHSVEDQGA